jgi:hypothetical protein
MDDGWLALTADAWETAICWAVAVLVITVIESVIVESAARARTQADNWCFITCPHSN